jgi:hypothetical protein
MMVLHRSASDGGAGAVGGSDYGDRFVPARRSAQQMEIAYSLLDDGDDDAFLHTTSPFGASRPGGLFSSSGLGSPPSFSSLGRFATTTTLLPSSPSTAAMGAAAGAGAGAGAGAAGGMMNIPGGSMAGSTAAAAAATAAASSGNMGAPST